MTGPSDWERGDEWVDDADIPAEHRTEDLPENITREAWDIAAVIVADYLDEGEPPHRPAGTNDIFLKEASRAARLNGLEPGQSTWAEILNQQVLYVMGSVKTEDLRRELTKLGLHVMQWLHDLNDDDPIIEIVVEDPDAGEVQAG